RRPHRLALAILRPDMERLYAADLVVDRPGHGQREVDGAAGGKGGWSSGGCERAIGSGDRARRARRRRRLGSAAGEHEGGKQRQSALHAPMTRPRTKSSPGQAASQEAGASSISPSSEKGPGSIASAASNTTVTSAGLLTDWTIVRSFAAPRNPRSPQAMNLRSRRGPRAGP